MHNHPIVHELYLMPSVTPHCSAGPHPPHMHTHTHTPRTWRCWLSWWWSPGGSARPPAAQKGPSWFRPRTTAHHWTETRAQGKQHQTPFVNTALFLWTPKILCPNRIDQIQEGNVSHLNSTFCANTVYFMETPFLVCTLLFHGHNYHVNYFMETPFLVCTLLFHGHIYDVNYFMDTISCV